jgi:hypothetical protein
MHYPARYQLAVRDKVYDKYQKNGQIKKNLALDFLNTATLTCLVQDSEEMEVNLMQCSSEKWNISRMQTRVVDNSRDSLKSQGANVKADILQC